MKSSWNDAEAAEFVQRYAEACGEALALRVYTSRLIGREPALVLHGGGNTSVKVERTSRLGEPVEVVCVKGSGCDLAAVEPSDLPAIELAPLRRLLALDALGDRDMVAEVRRAMLEPDGPRPSIEALMHAVLPHRYVDHTHADAVLILCDQPDGAAVVRDALGYDVAIVDWVMPGFPLAKAVHEAVAAQPDCTAVVLLGHGVVTFGDDAKASYERMIEVVARAEAFVIARARRAAVVAEPERLDDDVERRAAALLPVLRGAVALETGDGAGPSWSRRVACWQGDLDLLAFAARPDASELLARGPLTPDHVIRTGARALHLAAEDAADPQRCRDAVARFRRDALVDFQSHVGRLPQPPAVIPDPSPRVVVIEGVGVVAFGSDAKAARVAADIAAHTVRAIARAESLGRYQPLPRADVFDVEHWWLELDKLGSPARSPLDGQVALVTGAAGAIGFGIAQELLEAGAQVVLTDLDEARLAKVVAKLGAQSRAERIVAHPANVTDEAQVAQLFERACLAFGGVDVVVPNAGIAHVAKLEELTAAALRKVLDVNVLGTATVLRCAARVFEAQGTGGAVVVQSSKNVFDPGAGFGAYSASKAAVHQLGKIAALELAPLGVRVNMINADAVFGDEDVPSGLWQEVGPDRMRARGLDPQGLRRYYRERSLLKVSVTPRHVGRAVVWLASGATPTTGATLPVDGGIAGAFPR